MPDLAREIVALARVTELEHNSSATGFTLLKFRRTPIDYLVSRGLIGSVELQAANEFSAVFEHITRDLRFSRIDQVFRDRQQKVLDDREDSEAETTAWRNYRDFRNHWSERKKLHNDYTMAIFVAAVIDQQPFEFIAQEYGLSVEKTRRIVIRGLRDYAKRAGWSHSRPRTLARASMVSSPMDLSGISKARI